MGKKVVLDALGREMVVDDEEERKPEPERDDRLLRIYIYEDDNGVKKYYIDIFAAVELGLYDYKEACKEYNRGGRYYYLSLTLLKNLQERFAGRIRYIYLAKEKVIEQPNNNKDYFGYYPYQDYREFFDKVDNHDDDKPMFEESNLANYSSESINNRR